MQSQNHFLELLAENYFDIFHFLDLFLSFLLYLNRIIIDLFEFSISYLFDHCGRSLGVLMQASADHLLKPFLVLPAVMWELPPKIQ